MMKKFLFLIVTSVLVGMLGAYVTNASASSMLDFILNNVVSSSTVYASEVCPQRDPNCCKPTQGWVACDPSGWPRLVNSCGSVIGACGGNTTCAGPVGQASCQIAPTCDSDAPLLGCINSRIATNNCGKTQACATGYECRTWGGCEPIDRPVYWFCNNKSGIDGNNYGRYNTQGVSEVCPGGCNPDRNGDGIENDAICKSGSCPYISTNYRHCNADGNIANGCGEVVEDCQGQGLRCDGNQSSCKCVGDGDVCNNIDDVQLIVPSGYIRNPNGSCIPNPNLKPVRQCTAAGWVKTDKKREWANYDPDTAYKSGNEASLNEGETPESKTCNNPGYTQMRITKTANKTMVNSGDLVVYTITMHNDGPGSTAENTAISDTLPEGMIFVATDESHHIVDKDGRKVRGDEGFYRIVGINGGIQRPNRVYPPNGTGTWGPYDNGEWKARQQLPGDTYTWFWGEIPSGESRSLTITAQYDGSKLPGSCITNTAFGYMDAPEYPRNSDNDYDSATVCVDGAGDLSIDKQVNKSVFQNTPGQDIVWTLTYRNVGALAMSNVKIVDTLPAGLTNVTSLGGGVKSGSNQIVWNIGNLPVGAVGTRTFTTRYDGSQSDNQELINNVLITSDTLETNYANNIALAETKPSNGVCVEQPPVCDTECSNKKSAAIMIIADTSISMSDFGTKVPDMKNAISSFLGTLTNPVLTNNKLSDGHYVGLVNFGKNGDGGSPRLVNQIGTSIDAVDASVNALPRNPGTDYVSSLQIAYDQLQNSSAIIGDNPKYIILFTDGQILNTTNDPRPLATQIKNSGIKIIVVGIEFINQHPHLREVASPGLFFGSTNSSELSTILASIGEQELCESGCVPRDPSQFCCPVGTTPTDTNGDGVYDSCESEPTFVSCESNTVTLVPTSTGARVDYVCGHAGGTTGRLDIYSGASASVYRTVAGFGGSVSLPYGSYTAQCVVDDRVTYKVAEYVFSTITNNTCPYKKHTTNNTVCAVQANLGVAVTNPLNPSTIIGMMNPIPYCSTTQLADSNYVCQATVDGDTIYVRDDMACRENIQVTKLGRIGDYVRHDVDKDGIQDAGESGIAGVTVELYKLNSCSDSLGTPTATTTTNGSGYYLFTGLMDGNYKVKFVMPGGYNTFSPYMIGTATSATDSNAGVGGVSSCVMLADGESNLTIDAGVYYAGGTSCDPAYICCNGTCGGGPYCGDHTTDVNKTVPGTSFKEQCDNGAENGIAGGSCDKFCQETGNPPIGGSVSTGRISTVTGLQMSYVDPPDVMVGEFVPFWWQIKPDADVTFVNKCEDANSLPYNPSMRYVIGVVKSDALTLHPDGLTCEFQLFNTSETGPSILRPCNLKKLFETSELTSSYLARKNSPVERDSYEAADGASVIFPADWGTEFEKLGEYGINWKSISFTPCIGTVNTTTTEVGGVETTSTTVTYTKGVRHIHQPAGNNIFRLTVSQPYMVQKNGLSTSSLDRSIINRIVGSDGQSIISSITPTNYSLSGSANIGYLVSSFVNKYSALAQNSDVDGLFLGSKKVGNNDIYVYRGTNPIISTTSNLGNKTVIVKGGNLTIRGSIKGNVMFIVPDGHIEFVQLDSQYNNTQEVEGIYIAKSFASNALWNNDLDKGRRFDGRLVVNGMLASLSTNNADSTISTLRNQRRSVLRNWFNVPTITKQRDRAEIVKQGGSLTIASNPSLWTNLPPGANELMTALEAFK